MRRRQACMREMGLTREPAEQAEKEREEEHEEK